MRGKDRLIRSAGVVSSFTFMSRVLGLVRDVVCANFFGAGSVWSAFTIAFMVPNLMRRLMGEGALTAAFIPILSDSLHRKGELQARRLAGAVLCWLAVLMSAGILLTEAALYAVGLWYGGLTLSLTAWLLPYAVVICCIAILGGMLNVLNRFAVAAGSPVLLNIVMIAAVVVGARLGGWSAERQVYLLAGAVVFSGLIQVGLHLWAARASGFQPILNLDWRDDDIRRIARLMGPMVVGLAAVQINSLVDMLIAKFFVAHEGAPAILYYAQRIYQFPLGIFGVALATAIFPRFSRIAAQDDTVSFNRTLGDGLRLCLFIGIPATVGLALVGQTLVEVVFKRGEFDEVASRRVGLATVLYCLGIWAYMAQHIVVRAFYARKNSRDPVRIAAWMVLLDVVANLILVQFIEEAGVAVSTSVLAALQFVILCRVYRRKWGWEHCGRLWPSIVRTLTASAVMGLAVYGTGHWVAGWGHIPGHLAVRCLLMVAVGAVVFLATAWLINGRSIPEFKLHSETTDGSLQVGAGPL